MSALLRHITTAISELDSSRIQTVSLSDWVSGTLFPSIQPCLVSRLRIHGDIPPHWAQRHFLHSDVSPDAISALNGASLINHSQLIYTDYNQRPSTHSMMVRILQILSLYIPFLHHNLYVGWMPTDRQIYTRVTHKLIRFTGLKI
jgi:hypothetical protein